MILIFRKSGKDLPNSWSPWWRINDENDSEQTENRTQHQFLDCALQELFLETLSPGNYLGRAFPLVSLLFDRLSLNSFYFSEKFFTLFFVSFCDHMKA